MTYYDNEYNMFPKRLVFNLVGKKDLVNKASIEVKDIIFELTKEKPLIIMEKMDTIYNKINLNEQKYYINKYYFETDTNLKESAENVVNLCRYIRNKYHDFVHPWCMHVDEIDTTSVSNFMIMCKQVNCVYPLNDNLNSKKQCINKFLG